MNIKDLSNGCFLKARFCGVYSRNFKSKSNQGQEFCFYYLVVEESFTSPKIFLQLSKEAVRKGVYQRLSDDKYNGIVMLLPFYVRYYDGGINYFYSGSEMPLIFTPIVS